MEAFGAAAVIMVKIMGLGGRDHLYKIVLNSNKFLYKKVHIFMSCVQGMKQPFQ
jgi:hypothetical protein